MYVDKNGNASSVLSNDQGSFCIMDLLYEIRDTGSYLR